MAGLSRDLIETLTGEQRPDLPVFGGRRVGRDAGEMRVPIAKPKPVGPETSWRWFSPARPDTRRGPDWFRRQLHEIDPSLEVVWHPVNERWVVWFRGQKGWTLLFPVQYYPDGAYMPLDTRALAKCWDRCGRRWGSGKAYWERIEAEFVHDLKVKEQTRRDEAMDAAAGRWDFAQIKVAMRGKSLGNKFATHEAGD